MIKDKLSVLLKTSAVKFNYLTKILTFFKAYILVLVGLICFVLFSRSLYYHNRCRAGEGDCDRNG